MLALTFVAMSFLCVAMIIIEGKAASTGARTTSPHLRTGPDHKRTKDGTQGQSGSDAPPRVSRTAFGVAKMLASSLFVLVGALRADTHSAAGRFFVAALLLSWLGDLLLIPKGNKRVFLVGIVSFLLAHVMFIPAFAARGVDPTASLLAGAATLVPIVVVLRWLRPTVKGWMRSAVVAYVIVISAMLAMAFGCAVQGSTVNDGVSPILFVGAVVFYLSDLMVARERFVAPGYINRIFGIPLYFFAQLLLIAGFTH